MVGAPLVLGRAMGNLDTQTWGSHHLPLYSILYGRPQGPHPNGFLSQDSQVGVPKLPKLGFPRLWGHITLQENLRCRWGLKQSCSPCQELSNGMLHAICTQGNWVDSQLLMVRSQIVNLTPSPSFGHNLCFRYPNERCEPILDMYVPRAFQWYKKHLKPLGLTHEIALWRFRNPSGLHLPSGSCLGSVRVHSLTPSYTPGNMRCDSSASSWPATLQPLCLGREPKARVGTFSIFK